MKYEHIYAEVFHKPWAILPEKLATIAELVRMRAAGERLSDVEIRERIGAGPRPRPNTPGTVALICVYGVISHRMNMMDDVSGGTSIEKLQASVRQAVADPSVKAIVFDVDSPGGSVDGVPELAEEILAARDKKKTVAVCNTMAASAAYWLACCASELVITPSGVAGSIGVFAAHEDVSKALETAGVRVSLISAGKYKVEGNPYEPLSDEAKAAIQDRVNAYYAMFTKGVAKARGVTAGAVRDGFGEGRLLMAADAVKENLADKIATLDDTLARFGVSATPAQPQRLSARAERELSLHE